MKVQSISESILQYFWPTLSYSILKNIFWSFWEWPFYTGFTVYVISLLAEVILQFFVNIF